MADAYPRACFAVQISGQTVRVWGRLDELELTAGIAPNVAELRVPKHEYAKLGGDYSRSGNVELYWSSETVPDVTLKLWSIDHVEDTIVGAAPGEAQASVQEKALFLTDRRWEFTGGRGGYVFWGLVNQVSPDGKTISNPIAVEGHGDALDHYELIRLLGAKMQRASGGYYLDPDYIPTSLAIAAKPRNLRLDGAHIPSTLAKLVEEAEAAFTVDTQGHYYVYRLGSDSLPAEPPGSGKLSDVPPDKKLPFEPNLARNARGGTVVITSAPQRILQQEETYCYTHWDYVGLDTDGAVKWLGQLSYNPTGLTESLVLKYRNGFATLTDEQRACAEASVMRMVRLAEAQRASMLPILTRGVDVVADDATTDRALGVRVQAKCAVKAGDVWVNSDEWIEIAGFRVDPRGGIITFAQPLFRVEPSGVILGREHADVLGANQLRVTFCHEAQSERSYEDFFVRAYRLDGGGNLIAADAEAALAPEGGDVRVIRMPELVALRNKAGGIENEAELVALAQGVAGRLLKNPEGVETIRCVGLHNVSPTGTISSVRWDLRQGLTTVQRLAYYLARSRYATLKVAAASAGAGREAAVAAGAAPELARQGARDWAQPQLETHGSPPQILDGAGIQWAKIVQCYDGYDAWADYETSEGFAQWAKCNPYNPVTGVANTAVELHVDFPTRLGGDEGVARTGVRLCPPGTVICYFAAGDAGSRDGVEVGWVSRGLPSVFYAVTSVPTGGLDHEDWADEERSYVTGVRGPDPSGAYFQLLFRNVIRDRQGRLRCEDVAYYAVDVELSMGNLYDVWKDDITGALYDSQAHCPNGGTFRGYVVSDDLSVAVSPAYPGWQEA